MFFNKTVKIILEESAYIFVLFLTNLMSYTCFNIKLPSSAFLFKLPSLLYFRLFRSREQTQAIKMFVDVPQMDDSIMCLCNELVEIARSCLSTKHNYLLSTSNFLAKHSQVAN